jgi:hypothetical protein
MQPLRNGCGFFRSDQSRVREQKETVGRAPAKREFTMAIGYKVRISERQRKLIMRALTTTVVNNRRSASGEVLGDEEWMELIGVFAALNPQAADDMPEDCPHRFSCPHVRRSTVHIGR